MNKTTQIRQKIKDQVLSINPLDNHEKEDVEDVIAWINSEAELFRIEKPDKPPKHLVSYFLLVDKKQRSLLLVDHIKAQLWLPTGGHVELNEDPIDTVKREIVEELNVQATFLNNNTNPFFITVTKTVGLTAGHTDVSLWFLLEANKEMEIIYDKGEFNEIKWFTYDEILSTPVSKLDPQLHRFVEKLVTYLH